VHKLYGLKEQTDEITGKQTFLPEWGEENQIDDTAALALDEVSMLQDEIFHMIATSNQREVVRTDNSVPVVGKDVDAFLSRFERKSNQILSNLKVIFLGDPIQIPPVGKQGCIPFNEGNALTYGLLTLSLTDIIRQKEGSPILELATIIRENYKDAYLPYERETVLNDIGGVIFINRADKDVLYRLCDTYFGNARFKHDSDFMKVIAWTNRTVDFMNDKIRRMIYKDKLFQMEQDAMGAFVFDNPIHSPDELDRVKKEVQLPRILVGEKLIANSPIVEEVDFRIIGLFSTNDEFEVVSYDITNSKVLKDFEIKIYRTKVSYYNHDRNKIEYKTIEVVHEDSVKAFDAAVEGTKKAALKAPKDERGQLWKFHYMIKRKYADIKYNYAITGHKSQGSTYDNAIVIMADIDQNPRVSERNRIKYVAVTRAKQNLFIVE
jgi:hypothetical protein